MPYLVCTSRSTCKRRISSASPNAAVFEPTLSPPTPTPSPAVRAGATIPEATRQIYLRVNTDSILSMEKVANSLGDYYRRMGKADETNIESKYTNRTSYSVCVCMYSYITSYSYLYMNFCLRILRLQIYKSYIFRGKKTK